MKLSKNAEVKYRRQLLVLATSLRKNTFTTIVPILIRLQPEYINDSIFLDVYAKTLEGAFDNLRMMYSDINRQAQIVANQFVNDADQANKKRFYSSVENTVGVNLQSVLQNEGLEDVLVATTRENVSLIRSIPEEYFKNIESIVFTGTTQGSTAGSMIDQIRKQGDVSKSRAKLIARDQSSKLNSALTKERSQNLGIEEYIWRTAGDERVRNSHKLKNGRTFRWNKPPADTGNPGRDIQCRCVAQPIINI